MTISRPDLSYAVGLVNQFMQLPRKLHLDAVKHILRYAKATLDYTLFTDASTQVHGYTDLDWAGSVFDCRSTNGYMFSFGSAAVTWSSKKQSTIALLSTEVEYKGTSVAACECLWFDNDSIISCGETTPGADASMVGVAYTTQVLGVLEEGFVLIQISGSQICDWILADLVHWSEIAVLVQIFVTSSGFGLVPGLRLETQGSVTQGPHIAASDSSSDFDIMEGYLMQQHPESSSQDMHALGQQSGVSMFSRLKETLSRATRSEHATNEINEGDGEVDSPFTSQIDLVLSESVHVSTPSTTPICLSKLTPSETLLPDGRSFAEVQEVERYILAAKEKEIESLRKAEQRRATLAKAFMTSTNPLQFPELTTLKSQLIGSHIAFGSKDTSNASILDGVFLNENWEYNLQTEKLTDLYTSYIYHVGWLDVIQATSNSTSVDE
ncbi:hypothetical protein L7F22_018427 [Adiantum nelumboides]|nr:hypothetical protein [Adiantum nelumboides]